MVVGECSGAGRGGGVVHRVITELGVMDVTPQGLVLREVAPGVTVEEIQAKTEPALTIDLQNPTHA